MTEPPTTPKPTTTTTATTTTTTTNPTTSIVTTQPPAGCSPFEPADIVFALPPGESADNSAQALRFIRNVTSNLDIDSSAVRFGLVPKHCYSVPGFSLQDGSQSQRDVIAKLSSTVFNRLDSQAVLKYICDDSFQEVQGK